MPDEPLPAQLRALADLVERTEDALDAEVQAAQPAGVDPDGELLRADLTVIVPIATDADETDAAESADLSEQAAGGEPAAEESDAAPEPGADDEAPLLSDLTDTVRKDVLAVVKHDQEPHRRADDRDVTPAAIHHNLRAARDELGVEDLEAVVPTAPTGGESEGAGSNADADTAPNPAVDDEEPEWAATDGGVATAQTGASATCENCGNTVTRDYARVFSPDGTDSVRTCPDCPDLIREGDGTVRKKRSGAHLSSDEEVSADGDR